MTIGQRIKARRKELDMSADTLAEKLGKSRATVFRYENGDIKNLPLDILDPIAKALSTTPAHLMGWDYTTQDAHMDEIMCAIKEDIGLSDDECESLLIYAKMLRDKEIDPIHFKLYRLGLTNDELHEVYQYAEYIKNKRR